VDGPIEKLGKFHAPTGAALDRIIRLNPANGNLRTVDHFFLLNFWILPAPACRRLSVISPKKAHPAADRQGAKNKISGNLKRQGGGNFFIILFDRKG